MLLFFGAKGEKNKHGPLPSASIHCSSSAWGRAGASEVIRLRERKRKSRRLDCQFGTCLPYLYVGCRDKGRAHSVGICDGSLPCCFPYPLIFGPRLVVAFPDDTMPTNSTRSCPLTTTDSLSQTIRFPHQQMTKVGQSIRIDKVSPKETIAGEMAVFDREDAI
jgi:hypothetical protein